LILKNIQNYILTFFNLFTNNFILLITPFFLKKFFIEDNYSIIFAYIHIKL
jgi:hypothetical protein